MTLQYTFDQPDGCDVVFAWQVLVDGAVMGTLGTGVCGPGDCGLGVVRQLEVDVPSGVHTTTLTAVWPEGETAPSNARVVTVP